MSVDLPIVRMLFRVCLAPVFQSVGLLEHVLFLQNRPFVPKDEETSPHFTEYVAIFREKMLAGGAVDVEGLASYTVWSPSGAELTRAERLVSSIVRTLPVGDYLRDDGPSGTGCAVHIASATPTPAHKSATVPGWYVCPVEIKWQSFYQRT